MFNVLFNSLLAKEESLTTLNNSSVILTSVNAIATAVGERTLLL